MATAAMISSLGATHQARVRVHVAAAHGSAGSARSGSAIRSPGYWRLSTAGTSYDNLLACPRDHVEAVFAMLRRQNRRIEFTGGLEALALQDCQVELLASLRPRPTMFFAYDPGDDFETLRSVASRLLEAGFTAASHLMRVDVLIGFPKDTFALAEQRLRQMQALGFTPHAMLWRRRRRRK